MRLRSLLTLAPLPYTSTPSTTIRPFEIGSSRLIVRSSVDLPEPDGPQTTTTSPFSTVSLTLSSAL